MTFARCIIVAATLLALPALANPGHGHKHKHQDEATDDQARHDDAHGHSGFSDQEHDAIDAYFRAHPEARSELPPGLAKKGKVPPGWRKKLERGDRVPDDVWPYRQPLPRDILVKIPAPPVGVVYVKINDRIAKVVEKTHEVLDILGLPDPRNGPPR